MRKNNLDRCECGGEIDWEIHLPYYNDGGIIAPLFRGLCKNCGLIQKVTHLVELKEKQKIYYKDGKLIVI